jgi:enterochelin esterase family protein
MSFNKCFISIALTFCQCSFALSQQTTEPKRYRQGADSFSQARVPHGTVTTHELLESKIFPGTKRRYYVYVPKQYDPNKPAALMVFQDGHAYVNPDGEYRATVVMDNLIHRNEMPVTIGVFVDPGHKKDMLPDKPGWQPRPENRSLEYDTLSDAYSKFLLEEVLPLVKKDYSISEDPNDHAICGASSGGICAFTVAWQRPDQFRKVVSHIGSFTNIRHGDTYPGLIRAAEKKPLRVYLQDGSNDLDNQFGNWPLANQQMAKALKFKEYDFQFVYGGGAHNGNHGGAVLPDAMRWIWQGHEGVQAAPLSISPAIQDAKWAVDWWMPRHEEKLAAKDAMEQVDLLMVGDSITHSWEGVGKSVFEKYYQNRNALNIGFSGDRTEHVLWRIQNGAIDGISPKLAVLMIGTNNTGHRKDDPNNTVLGIQFIVSELRQRLPDTKILLLGVFPRQPEATGDMRTINRKVNEKISGMADDQHIWVMNINSKFLTEDGSLSKDIMPDLLHPNAKGYELWAEAIEPTVKKLMGEK